MDAQFVQNAAPAVVLAAAGMMYLVGFFPRPPAGGFGSISNTTSTRPGGPAGSKRKSMAPTPICLTIFRMRPWMRRSKGS